MFDMKVYQGYPTGIALAPGGGLYIADSEFRVRRLGTDGRLSVVAGGNGFGYTGDGGPATAAKLSLLADVAVGPDGSLYLAERVGSSTNAHRIRKVRPDGTITTIAGNGVECCGGEGIPATTSELRTSSLAIGPDGSVYYTERASTPFATRQVARIRRIAPDGSVRTLVGKAPGATTPEGTAAADTLMDLPRGVAVDAQTGAVYYSDLREKRVRKVHDALPGVTPGESVVVAEDGTELYVFDAGGRHLRTLDALTAAVRRRFGYDTAGRLVTVTDGSGNVTRIARDGAGNATAITAPGGQRTTLAMGSDGLLASLTNPAGEVRAFSYDSAADGLMVTSADANGNVHRFAYDALGLLVRDEDPTGAVQTLVRTATASGWTVKVTGATGIDRRYAVERFADGGVRRVNSDRNGSETVIVSRADGTQTATYPDGSTVTLTLGADPRFGMQAPIMRSMTRTTPGGRVQTTTFGRAVQLDGGDIMKVLTLTDTAMVNGKASTSRYDGLARTTTTTSAEGRQVLATMDAAGRVTSKQLGAGLAPVTIAYDTQGRIVRMGQATQFWNYTYDSAGRVTTRTDALGGVTRYRYDLADRRTEVTLPSGAVYRYAYDANGNRTAVTMPSGATHALGYTAFDRQARYASPGGGILSRAYNADRKLASQSLPGGRVVDFTYDTRGRLAGIAFAEAAIGYGYGAGDPTDRLATATRTPAGSTTADGIAFAYDASYPVRVEWTGTAAGVFSYAYDNDFLLSSLALASGTDTLTLPLTHDRDGLLTGIGSLSFTRDGPAGATSRIGDTVGATALGYDALARPASRTQTVGAAQTYDARYTYDAAGRIALKVESVGATVRTYAYAYDPDGALTRVTRDGIVIERYTYDANGNRLSRQIGAAAAESATYDLDDRLTALGAVTYAFDADGFLAVRGSDTFTYSARGELLAATVGGQTVTYRYDLVGRRISRTAAGATTTYLYGNPSNPFQVTASRAPSGVLTTFIYDEAGLVVTLERAGARLYVATDHVGTPRRVVDAAGTVVKELEYDAFGVLLSDSAPAFDLPLGFAGGIADSLTGLVRFGFRDYDPLAGRWVARDPLLFGGGQDNLYVYAGNDPLNKRDPSGLFCIGFSAYIGLGAGASICYDGDDFSVCAETGFGFGGGLDVGAGAAERDGTEFGAEVKAGCGPVNVGASLFKLDSAGCLTGPNSPKLEIGPLVIGKDSGLTVDVESDAVNPATWGKCSAQGKVYGKVCSSTKK